MHRRSLAHLVLALAIVLCAGLSFAQFRLTPGERDARNAEYLRRIGTFCRLDFDGARLSSDGWARLQPLTTWRENPEFSAFSVISRYQILPEVREEHGHAVISVQFEVSGRYDLREGYLPDSGTMVAQYQLDDLGATVKISDIDPQRPFVGHARFVQWIEAKIDKETDPALKALFEASLRRFREQNASTK